MGCVCHGLNDVETKMVSSDISPNPEEGNWVVYVGYIERCKACRGSLGDGYGDPDFFPTREIAKEVDKRNKATISKGEWK